MRNLLFTLLLINSCILTAQSQDIPVYFYTNSANESASLTAIANESKEKGFSLVNIEYSSKFERLVKDGNAGVYYAPPHFASWLITRFNFTPVLTLQEPLYYYIIVQQENTQIFELSDLARHNVCVRPPLTMDFLFFRKQFRNSVSAPLMESINDPEKTMLQTPSYCDAYVMNNHQAERLFATNPVKFIKLARSEPFDNYQFVAHPDISEDTLMSIEQWLIQHQSSLSPIYQRNSTLAELSPAKKNHNKNHLLNELSQYWQEPSAK